MPFALGVLLRLLLALVPNEQESAPLRAALEIDHVIVGIDSLERGIEQLRDLTGITAVYGGAHPGRGTHNALISLGEGTYLELLAPDHKNPVKTPATDSLAALRLLTPIGFAMRMTNADSVRAELVRRGLSTSAVRPGSRARPDGSMLRWRTLAPWGDAAREVLPFFIEWMQGPHPARDSPKGCTLRSLDVGTTVPDSILGTFFAATVKVRVHPAPRDLIWVRMECPTGRVDLPIQLGKRFPWPESRPAPTAAGISIGSRRAEVEAILGKPDDVATPQVGLTLLVYERGSRDGLQIGLRNGRVDGVNLLTPEAGSVDSVSVGDPSLRLLTRWGEPRLDLRMNDAVWAGNGWEIRVRGDEKSVRIIQLLRRSTPNCVPLGKDSLGRIGFECDLPPDR